MSDLISYEATGISYSAGRQTLGEHAVAGLAAGPVLSVFDRDSYCEIVPVIVVADPQATHDTAENCLVCALFRVATDS